MRDILPNQYFDLGSWNTWNLADWGTSSIKKDLLDNYLNTFASQTLAQGIRQVTLSFGQVADIRKMINGDYANCSATNAFYIINKNTGGFKVDNDDFFPYVSKSLAAKGLKVYLAFGGIKATQSDWTFDFSTTPPATLAQNLITWASTTCSLSGLDFDLELSDLTQFNNIRDLQTFFSSLKSITTTLTIQANYADWGPEGSELSSLFKSPNSINTLFDGLNLMCYNGKYYLNAGQTPLTDWDLIEWVKQMQKNTTMSLSDIGSFLHIGFSSALDYTSPETSEGPLPYNPSNVPSTVTTSGQYAAYIQKQLESSLTQSFSSPIAFASPLFWTQNANYTINTADGGTSHFYDDISFQKDFLNTQTKIKQGDYPMKKTHKLSNNFEAQMVTAIQELFKEYPDLKAELVAFLKKLPAKTDLGPFGSFVLTAVGSSCCYCNSWCCGNCNCGGSCCYADCNGCPCTGTKTNKKKQ